ncbi:MAG: hypothetical protein ACI81R_002747 [Bradymonadia bacterium]|jgi:hypothetical protein
MTRSTTLIRAARYGASFLAICALAACGGDEGESSTSNTCSLLSPADCPAPTVCLVEGAGFEGVCGLPTVADAGVDVPDATTDVIDDTADAGADVPDTADTADTAEEVTDPTETQCADGADNDGDGDTDCADSDCAAAANCVSEAGSCDDGVDNDNDGRTDCFDTDCVGDAACPSVETNCADGIDDDFDSTIDCLDSDCAATPACPETNCTDRIDNNNNGTLDCADLDCAGVGFCGPEAGAACGDARDNDGDGAIDCNDLDCESETACEREFVPWVVYQAGVSALPTLFVISADGSEGPFPIEDDSVAHIARLPAFSDDGSLLAYDYAATGFETIRVLTLETGEVDDLGNGFFTTVSQPSFSADGSTVAVIGTTPDFPQGNIYTINIATRSVTGPITNQLDELLSVQSPLFSADGTQLFFIRGIPGQEEATGDMFSVNTDGTGELQLTEDLVLSGGLKISLDRTAIVFKPNGEPAVVFTIADGTLRSLSSGDIRDSSTSFYGTTGNFLVSRGVNVSADIFIADLFVVSPAGAEVLRLTNTPTTSEGAPVASPLPFDALTFVVPE